MNKETLEQKIENAVAQKNAAWDQFQQWRGAEAMLRSLLADLEKGDGAEAP